MGLSGLTARMHHTHHARHINNCLETHVFAIVIGGVVAWNFFSCKNKQILIGMQQMILFFHEYGNGNNFQSNIVRVTHSQFIIG